MALEVFERNSAHFRLRCAADSPVAAGADAILARLETARSRLVSILELADAPPTPIPVLLVEVLPEVAGRSSIVTVDGAQGIVATYHPDAPAIGLERSLAALLVGSVGSWLLVDGLLAHALRDHEPAPTDLRGEIAKGNIRLSALLADPAGVDLDANPRVVASVAGYLLERFGAASYAALIAEVDPSDPDAAFVRICGVTLASIEQAWLQTLDHAAQPAPAMGMGAVLRRCAGYLRPYWLPSVGIGLCLLVATAFDLLLPLSFRFLIDNAILPQNYGLMTAIIGGLLALFLAQTLATLAREYLAARVGAGVLNRLRARLFEHLQTLSPGFFAHAQTGDLLARYSSDLVPLELIVTKVLPLGSMVLIGLAGSIALLFALEWQLALITLVLLPSFALGPALLGRRAAQASYQRQRDAGSVMSAAQESIRGQTVIRAFGLKRFFARRFADELDRFAISTIRSSFLGSLLGAGGGISMSLTQVVSLGLGAYLVARGEMSVGALVAFQGLLANVVGPLRELAQIVEMLQQASGALRHLDEVLDEQPGVTDAPDAVRLPRLRDQVQFDHVTFRYEDGTLALSDVSFSIRAGQSLAIVGRSGSGKSTVLNLLMRNTDPTSGSVTVDGLDLRHGTQESLRAQLSVVFQDTALFNMTVRDNIRLGRLDASDADVEQAAHAAEVHDAILDLPAGYDTVVGEGGGRLSGGQRQRIALARALVRNPAMLVLDEPTSALDPETERTVNATLDRLRQGRTTVTVTHRLHAVANSDQIVVLERGRVVECGTHAELARRDGVYHRLWQQAQLSPETTAGEVGLLQDVPLFRTLDTVLLTALAERFTRAERAGGETFFHAGDSGDAFYLILRGQVDVLATGPTGEQVSLAVLREGDYFGEMALIDDVPRTATVRARTPTTVLVIYRDEFLALLNRLPRLRRAFEAIVKSRRASDQAVLGGAHQMGTGNRPQR